MMLPTALPRPIATALLAVSSWARTSLLTWATVAQLCLIAGALVVLAALWPRLQTRLDAGARRLHPVAMQLALAALAAAP